MSDMIQRIRMAQVRAAEDLIVSDLQQKGLAASPSVPTPTPSSSAQADAVAVLREALTQSRAALAELKDRCAKVKDELNTGIPDGEPAHPCAVALTWPMSTAGLAINKADAALSASPATAPASEEAELWPHLIRQAERWHSRDIGESDYDFLQRAISSRPTKETR
jgi:hypothetical protein